MITLKEKIAAASEVNELALNFAQHYFAEYAYLRQLSGNKERLRPSYYEDEVSIDYIDGEGESISLKWEYEVGSYGNYEQEVQRIHVLTEQLEEFIIDPIETIKNLALKNTEIYRKQQEEKERLEKEKQIKEEQRKKDAKYQQ